MQQAPDTSPHPPVLGKGEKEKCCLTSQVKKKNPPTFEGSTRRMAHVFRVHGATSILNDRAVTDRRDVSGQRAGCRSAKKRLPPYCCREKSRRCCVAWSRRCPPEHCVTYDTYASPCHDLYIRLQMEDLLQTSCCTAHLKLFWKRFPKPVFHSGLLLCMCGQTELL